MPVRYTPATQTRYYLVCFDRDGNERAEAGARLTAQLLRELTGAEAPTDIFLLSHGWMGDIPAAIAQYDRWIDTFMSSKGDVELTRDRGLRPLVVGLHWPSLPWGDEKLPAGQKMLLDETGTHEMEVGTWTDRIAETPAAADAIRHILDASMAPRAAGAIPGSVRGAYQSLFQESGLESGHNTKPGADQTRFDIDAILAATPKFDQAGGSPGVLNSSVWDGARDLMLAPLRTMSFWKMKDRARSFGEGAAHDLLRQVLLTAPNARVHVMGHSFGCIVAAAAVTGTDFKTLIPRPVNTLMLVQGALSLWAFSSKVPFGDKTPGYFNTMIGRRQIKGPIIVTTSRYDSAVGRYYPAGASVAGQYLLNAESLPKYGGLATYGMQGIFKLESMDLLNASDPYEFMPGVAYNIDCSRVVCNGSGPSGAHSDIAHPELAHLFWSGIGIAPIPLSTQVQAPQTASHEGGMLLGSSDDDRPVVRERPDLRANLRVPADHAPPADARLHSQYQLERSRQHRTEDFSVGMRDEGGRQEQQSQKPQSPVHEQADLGIGPSSGSGSSPDASARSARPSAPPAASPPPIEAAKQIEEIVVPRLLTAEIEDRTADKPLLPGSWYTLSFGVDVEKHQATIAAASLVEIPIEAEADSVLVSIVLDSDDVAIATKQLPLRVPRRGASATRAKFGISPIKDGPAVIRATVHKDNNYIQQLELTFQIGENASTVVTQESKGRSISSADVLQPRQVSLIIDPRDSYYECLIIGPVHSRTRLQITESYLAETVRVLREALLEVIKMRDESGGYPFQQGLKIGELENRRALTLLAKAGARIFQRLFAGPAAGADSIALGECLRKSLLETDEVLNVQITAARLPVPWGLVYLGDPAEELDWNKFLGFRHIVDQMPLQNFDPVRNPVIASDPALFMGTHFNGSIDAQFGVHVVASQFQFWKEQAEANFKIKLAQRSSKAEIATALGSAELKDQILYFYCHAKTFQLGEVHSPGESKLSFADGDITLDDLYEMAPVTKRFRGSPLVFINACESAELSALFYDGFVPYFIARGSRGVIGTECSMPALFAAEWAPQFFKYFLAGGTLGAVVYKLRRQYLQESGNPLGLLYAVYCDPGTAIRPPLQVARCTTAAQG